MCKCDKGVWANMTPLEQKYSCERSEWALCTLMNKYKKKDCYYGGAQTLYKTQRKQKLEANVDQVTCTEESAYASRQWMQLFNLHGQTAVHRLPTIPITHLNSWWNYPVYRQRDSRKASKLSVCT